MGGSIQTDPTPFNNTGGRKRALQQITGGGGGLDEAAAAAAGAGGGSSAAASLLPAAGSGSSLVIPRESDLGPGGGEEGGEAGMAVMEGEGEGESIEGGRLYLSMSEAMDASRECEQSDGGKSDRGHGLTDRRTDWLAD